MSRLDVESAYRFLLDLPRFAVEGDTAYKPGLERIRRLLRLSGDPHLNYPCVHIAGSNGKGSVASMTASMLTAGGHRTGLHTSPHLHSLEERMRIGAVPAAPEWVAASVEDLRELIEDVGASFFEATVLLTFLYFAEFEVDVGVFEVGLGGRYDATNVITPAVSVITDIGLEHTDILGETIGEIAREKAGIIKPGVPALTIADGTALEVMEGVAVAIGSSIEDVRGSCTMRDVDVQLTESRMTLVTPRRRYDNLVIGIPGQHQLWNAAIAVRAIENLSRDPGLEVPEDALRSGLERIEKNTGLSGRFAVLNREPLIVADVAHNPQSVEVILGHLSKSIRGRLHVALGLMQDKDAERIAILLAASGATVSVVPIDSDRAINSQTLYSLLKRHGLQVDIQRSVSRVLDGFRQTADTQDVLLLTGSHYVAASALEAVGFSG